MTGTKEQRKFLKERFHGGNGIHVANGVDLTLYRELMDLGWIKGQMLENGDRAFVPTDEGRAIIAS